MSSQAQQEQNSKNEQLFENSQRQLIDMLERQLEREIELLKTYHVDQAMAIGEQVLAMAERIGAREILKQPEFKNHKKRIDKLFKQLDLGIAQQRKEVADKLSEIRNARMALSGYNDNL
jgi:esterase/lipase